MTRMVHELGRATNGTVGHITSLNPIRPENVPDPWEVEALQAFEQGETEKSGLGVIDGIPYMRLMRPLFTESACLKCHAEQGYEMGDIRGGISISIPTAPWQAVARDNEKGITLGHGALWVFGLIGLVPGRWKIMQGIKMRTHAEEALRESERRFRTLVERNPQGIQEIDSRGTIVYANKSHYDMYGCKHQELLGRSIEEFLVPGSQRAELPGYLEKLVNDQPPPAIYHQRVLRADGVERDIEVSWDYLRDEEGSVSGFMSVLNDVTERKRMEEEIRKAHNLESLGVLAGGIAHDFNNVLTGVIGNLSLLERLLSKNSKEYKFSAAAKKSAVKATELTSQLMTFAKGGAPVKKTATVEELIVEVTGLTLHGSNTKPEYQFADDLRSADMDVGQISQVMQNLVINGDQAMPNGGILKISANNVEISADDPLPLDPGSYVRIIVADEGLGMAEEIMKHVFDPYFSTKDGGHGLGLTISYRIIERHGGHMTVKSEVGVGTTFVIYLPASENHAVTNTDPEKELAFGKGRILLMDDEEGIRAVVGAMLTELGYEVEAVNDGLQALKAYGIAKEADTPYALVIMDLTIPGGMGGREAVERLRELHPEARVIVASGYSNDPVMANYQDYGFSGRLKKPIRLVELAVTVEKVLE